MCPAGKMAWPCAQPLLHKQECVHSLVTDTRPNEQLMHPFNPDDPS